MITEQNIKRSFEKAREDIYSLQMQIQALKLEVLALKAKKKVVAVKKAVKRRFVASKTGSKVHAISCAFAKNIKPKKKKFFASKNTALNQGFKKCSCVN